jgi:magnesium chelatase family protein
MLVAALNPCPCGYRTDPRRNCNCTPNQIDHYMGKISGPLLDRIDIHIEVPAVPFSDLSAENPGTSSEEMRAMVITARQRQEARFSDTTTRYNAQMSSRQLRQYCPLCREGRELMRNSVADMGLSARAHDKIIRVSRTIADMDGSDNIHVDHLHEAINYRMLDRQIWT